MKKLKFAFEQEAVRSLFDKKAYIEVQLTYKKDEESEYKIVARKKKTIIHHMFAIFISDGEEANFGLSEYRCNYIAAPIVRAAMEYYMNFRTHIDRTTGQIQNESEPTVDTDLTSKRASTISGSSRPRQIEKLLKIFVIIGVIGATVIAIIASLNALAARESDDVPNDSVFYTDLTLSKTYTNEIEGFSFNYPDSWTINESVIIDDENFLIYGMHTIMAAQAPARSGFFSSLYVVRTLPDGTLTASKKELLSGYSVHVDNAKIITVYDFEIDRVSVRKIISSHDDEKGSYITMQYVYVIGQDMYIVNLISVKDQFDDYEPVFNAIMNSYRIIRTDNVNETASLTANEARIILQNWINTHPFVGSSELYPEYSSVMVNGEECFMFDLGIERLGVIEILVGMETGEMFHYSSPGNDMIEQLDDWYYRDMDPSASQAPQPEEDDYSPVLLFFDALLFEEKIELLIYWNDGRRTLFEGEQLNGDWRWYMHGRDGGEVQEVYPTFDLDDRTIEIRFPTTERVYYLYDDFAGIFGTETFSWSFASW